MFLELASRLSLRVEDADSDRSDVNSCRAPSRILDFETPTSLNESLEESVEAATGYPFMP